MVVGEVLVALAGARAVATAGMDRVEGGMRRIGRRYGRPIRDALVVIGLLRAVLYFGGPVTILGVEVGQGIHPWEFLGVDARAYWAVDLAHPYAQSGVGVLSTYLYSPAFAQVLAPFSLVPFGLFYALWTVMLIAILIWPILYELAVGQVHLLIAAAIVVGFARPGAWALPILTKLTPGIGLLWFVLREEWRALAEAVGVTLLVVAISFALAPTAWLDWFTFLTSSTQRGQALWLRVGVGIGLMVLAGLSGRPWIVPIAVWIAIPVVWIESWVILLAVIRTSRMSLPSPDRVVGQGSPRQAPG